MPAAFSTDHHLHRIKHQWQELPCRSASTRSRPAESHRKVDSSSQIPQLIPPCLNCPLPLSLGHQDERVRLLREVRDQQIHDNDVFVSAANSINACVSMTQASGGVVDMRCGCHGERSLVDFELKGIELLPKGLSRHLPQAQERLRIQHQ